MTMRDDMSKILADLAEIRALASAVATHDKDIGLVKKDIEGIMKRVASLERTVSDYPGRLERLERKQASDDQDRQDDENMAVGHQENVNVTFRDRIAELFDVTTLLQKASLKLFTLLLIIGVSIVSIFLKFAGY